MPVITDIKRSGIESLKLTLNKEEIQFLVDVLNHIGGTSENSRRKIARAIRDALSNAGVNTDPRSPRDLTGNLCFDDIPPVKNKKVVWDSRNDNWNDLPF